MVVDPRALVRVLVEFLWTLRRDGFEISTAQAIDVARAVEVVGLEHPARVREAIACLTVRRASERPRFDAAFAGPSPITNSLAPSVSARILP